jgi:DNA-binding NtrC family response regulator/tetratricopeptide (TPR) repeat protein
MARLLRDRYYEYAPDQAWDLATGDDVRLSQLQDQWPARDVSLAPLAEVLEHGRDGAPRWIVADAARDESATLVRAAAEEARRRGFVPIAADVYLRLRPLLAKELCDRALVLIAAPPVPLETARSALIDASGRSARPHVLLTLRTPGSSEPSPRSGPGNLVREARAVYGVHSLRASVPLALPTDVKQQLARASRAGDFARRGRHAAAERLLRDVAGSLVRRRAFGVAAETYVSLGRLLLERGRAQAADASFGEAAAQAEAAGDEPLVIGARLWQAAARTDCGQLTAAESLCRAALVAGGLDRSERIRAEAALARVLVWQGRADDAASLEFMNQAARELAPPFVEATAVRVLLGRGQLFEAGQRARHLLTSTDSASDTLAAVIGQIAHLRVLIATGDLALAEERLRSLRALTRAARSPLRLARARILWLDALRRAGRGREADRELQYLKRIRVVAPPLLRSDIDRRLRGIVDAPANHRPVLAVSAVATSLLTIAQREDDDGEALRGLFEFTARTLHTSRLELWSADAGPATCVLSAGSGLPTRLGQRVLEAGIAIGPERDDPGHELGVPVRLGAKLLGAFVARWPVDRTPAASAGEVLTLAAAVAAPRVECRLAAARETSRAASAIPELVGAGRLMVDVRRAVTRAASAPFAVLIEGESGAGKELVARAIHHLSPRRERRFCDVNCAALPDELLESELFGHARGAFTGAVADRAGLFEEADGGTLFLDEVVDLSGRAQAKLLRVLQQQEVRRVGETFSRKVDVRCVSAANRNLRTEADGGRFRQDLLYRLDVIRIRVPPLRERPEDIPELAVHIWRIAAARVGTRATLGHAVLAALSRYHWPGNVRELQNVIAALAVEAPTRGQVRATLLPSIITGVTAVSAGRLADARLQFERRFVEVALARAGGSRTRASRELGLSRQGLLKLLARLQIT